MCLASWEHIIELVNGHIGCYANYLVVWLSLRGFSFAWKYRESKKKMLSILFCYRSDPCLQIFSTRMWTFQVVCTELTGRSDLSTASWRTLTCNSETADCNPVSEKALKFLSRNRCQSHLCVIFIIIFFLWIDFCMASFYHYSFLNLSGVK